MALGTSVGTGVAVGTSVVATVGAAVTITADVGWIILVVGRFAAVRFGVVLHPIKTSSIKPKTNERDEIGRKLK